MATNNCTVTRDENLESEGSDTSNLLPITNTRQSCRSGLRKYIGLTLSIIASLSFAFNSLTCKILVQKYNVFFVSFARVQGVLFPSLVIFVHARYFKHDPIFDNFFPLSEKGNQKSVLIIVIRGVVGSIVTVALTYALKFISVGDVIVVKSSTPLLVIIFASCCLNERLGFIPVICGLQIILGIFCIAKPSFMTGNEEVDENNLIGTLLASTVAVAVALGIICMRHSRKLHFSIPPLSMGIIGSLTSGIACAVTHGFEWPATLEDTMYFLTIGLCTALTQIMTVLALKYDNAGFISLVRTSEVFFAFVLEITILKVTPDSLNAIGAIIVVLAVFIAIASKK